MTENEKLQFHLLDGNGKACGVFDYAVQEYIKEKAYMSFWKITNYTKVHDHGNWLKNFILIVILFKLLFVNAYKGILKPRSGQKSFLTVTKSIVKIQNENL